MNDFVLNQMEDWTKSAEVFKIPEPIKNVIDDTAEQTNENLATISALLRDASFQYQEPMETAEDTALSLSASVIDHTRENAARLHQLTVDLMSASSPREVAEIQTRFWQTQSEEWLRLSTELFKISQEMIFFGVPSSHKGAPEFGPRATLSKSTR